MTNLFSRNEKQKRKFFVKKINTYTYKKIVIFFSNRTIKK